MWTETTGYTGTTGGGKTFGIYDSESPSPMEMVLHGHAACSLIDVIDGLKHRKKHLEFIKVEIEAIRACPTLRDPFRTLVIYELTAEIR